MSASFVAANNSLVLFTNIRYIPSEFYATANLNNFYFWEDDGGAGAAKVICRSPDIPQLASLNNHAPCNATYLQIFPGLITDADICVTFTCASPETANIAPAQFVNFNVAASICSPINSSYCPVTFKNSHGGVNLDGLIYPVTQANSFLINQQGKSTPSIESTIFSSNSNNSSNLGWIIGISVSCAMLILAGFFYSKCDAIRRRKTSHKFDNMPIVDPTCESPQNRPNSNHGSQAPAGSHPKLTFQQTNIFTSLTRLQQSAGLASVIVLTDSEQDSAGKSPSALPGYGSSFEENNSDAHPPTYDTVFNSDIRNQ